MLFRSRGTLSTIVFIKRWYFKLGRQHQIRDQAHLIGKDNSHAKTTLCKETKNHAHLRLTILDNLTCKLTTLLGQFKMKAHDTSWTSLHSHSHVPKLDQIQQEDYHETHDTFGQSNMQTKSCKDTHANSSLRHSKTTHHVHSRLEFFPHANSCKDEQRCTHASSKDTLKLR